MADEKAVQAIELTNRIIEMIEGEKLENLEEYIRLLEYHAGIKAGIYNGNLSFSEVMSGREKLDRRIK